jgi:cephalosporin hydroxylase
LTDYKTKVSQVESEIAGFIGVLQREGVRSFLEIGSRFGGSLWRIANALPKGARIVSCDSGKGMGGRKPGATDALKACVKHLGVDGYDAHLIVGDSHRAQTITEVRKLGPFDAAFIDGDHEYRGVLLDWKNYGPLARIVAFHDVGWIKPDDYQNSKMVEVPRLWAELKQAYRHEEFIDYSEGPTYGIGVLWRN